MHLSSEIFLKVDIQNLWNIVRLRIKNKLSLLDALKGILVLEFNILDLFAVRLNLIDERLIIILKWVDLFLLVVIQIHQLLSSLMLRFLSIVYLQNSLFMLNTGFLIFFFLDFVYNLTIKFVFMSHGHISYRRPIGKIELRKRFKILKFRDEDKTIE